MRNITARDTANEALARFSTELSELRSPARAVIAQAVRSALDTRRHDADEAARVAAQSLDDLIAAFEAFDAFHQDTPERERLAEEIGQTLGASRTPGDTI